MNSIMVRKKQAKLGINIINKTSIGQGMFVEVNNSEVALTTINGNIIYMNKDTTKNLIKFLKLKNFIQER